MKHLHCLLDFLCDVSLSRSLQLLICSNTAACLTLQRYIFGMKLSISLFCCIFAQAHFRVVAIPEFDLRLILSLKTFSHPLLIFPTLFYPYIGTNAPKTCRNCERVFIIIIFLSACKSLLHYIITISCILSFFHQLYFNYNRFAIYFGND